MKVALAKFFRARPIKPGLSMEGNFDGSQAYNTYMARNIASWAVKKISPGLIYFHTLHAAPPTK